MMRVQLALLQREIWEHRSILVTPAVIGIIMVLMSVTGQVTVSVYDQAVDLAILGASNLGERERGAAISVLSAAVSMLFIIAMAVLTVFYLLDALYTERRDKSILFWRSLPVTDAETVLSKVLTAVIVIPLVTMAAVIITQLIVLAISSMWISGRGGDGWSMIWGAAPLLQNWAAIFVMLLALPLWYLPLAGWFLFVSAWTKRSPFLFAILPLIILPMLERILLGSTHLRDAIFVRSAKMPLFAGEESIRGTVADLHHGSLPPDAGISLLSFVDVSRFLGDIGLWLGIVVGSLFIAAAIYIRRYRDES